MTSQLRAGDLVEVLTAKEILRTLDDNSSLDGLPFMPEMLQFCGSRYRVSQRVVQAAIDDETQSLREFKNNDVVLLQEIRCSGLSHDGCQRGCMIFWKEAWLKKLREHLTPQQSVWRDIELLRSQLKTKAESGTYFCQSTEFQRVTKRIPRWQRLGKCFTSVKVGNCSSEAMIKKLLVWGWWKFRQKLFGAYPRGACTRTPMEVLALQRGDMIEVRPLGDIVKTLDRSGKNRGLHFSPDMLPFCGKQYRVRSRADRLVDEISGQMRELPHTVILEDVLCDSAYYAFGGCPRSDFQYWREIWLKRTQKGPSDQR